MDEEVLVIILIVVAAIVLFFVLRELFCWYCKVNKRIKLLEEQNSYLKEICEKLNVGNKCGACREQIQEIIDSVRG